MLGRNSWHKLLIQLGHKFQYQAHGLGPRKSRMESAIPTKVCPSCCWHNPRLVEILSNAFRLRRLKNYPFSNDRSNRGRQKQNRLYRTQHLPMSDCCNLADSDNRLFHLHQRHHKFRFPWGRSKLQRASGDQIRYFRNYHRQDHRRQFLGE